MHLAFHRPFAAMPLRRFLAAHAIPGVETYDAVTGEHSRTVPGESGPAFVRFALPTDPAAEAVHARLVLCRAADRDGVVARLRHWLDLDVNPRAVEDVLARDPTLEACVRERPGLRVPGTVDSAELAMLAVLGQQVSLAAARTFAARLVAGCAPLPALRGFPSPAVVYAMGPDRIKAVVGLTTARARTLHALSGALAGGLKLDRVTGPMPGGSFGQGSPADLTRAALLRLPGIGPWTADYIALRALGDTDAFPAGDLVLRRAMGVRTPAEAQAAAAGWRPWRAYGVLHLWTREVFS